ncbi:MAG TPA: serine/threonine-protein kinase [Polyangiaceae bacterium]|nr:serine/threonine-protein kinase [Polyangiaceae bacterium]
MLPEEPILDVGPRRPRTSALGKYRLVAELARGGMGVVYLALARGPGGFSKLLVLKELRPALLEEPAAVSMFMQEARLAACLSHPNIVETLEVGSDGERHYIAMEYLDGQSLYRVLARARQAGVEVPLAFQVSVICEALEGLAYAHTAVDYDGRPLGVVHRDISPHNIFIGYDGRVKVLDFGIAKAVTTSDTETGVLKGKVGYMAPEHAAGSLVDARADLFAIGQILVEAATGRRFWSAVNGDMMILNALLQEMSPLSREGAMDGVPAALVPVLAKAANFDPNQRYATAAELRADLVAARAAVGVESLDAHRIGSFVHELFAEDRAQLKAAIEDAMCEGRGPVSGQFPAAEVQHLRIQGDMPSLNMRAADPVSWNPSYRVALASTRLLSSLPPASPAAPSPAVAPPPRPSHRARRAFVVAAIAVACVAAVAGVALSRGGAGRSAAGSVRVAVRVTPPNARILLDGQPESPRPLVTSLPKGAASHVLHVEADGYVPVDETFDAEGDTTLVIALEPQPTR